MNRRGILGVLAAAPFAGPEVAKMAAHQQGTQAGVGGLFSGAQQAMAGSSKAGSWMEPDEAVWRAFNLGIISRDKLAELIASSGLPENVSEHNLDPDIRAARSFSLAAKLRMQRQRGMERSVERFLSRPGSIWEFGRELLTKGLIKDDAA